MNNPHQKFSLRTSLAVSSFPNEWKDCNPSGFTIDGTLEEILKSQHLQLLSIFSRQIAEDENNKHLNLDSLKLFEQFKEKYKITNLDSELVKI